jgi:hypothetical protein
VAGCHGVAQPLESLDANQRPIRPEVRSTYRSST